MSSPPRLNKTLYGAPAAEGTTATSLLMAGQSFATAAAGLGQGLTREHMLSRLATLGWPLEEIQNFDDVVLTQLIGMILGDTESGVEEPLHFIANQADAAELKLDGLIAEELAELTDSDMNPSWYLDSSYWQGNALPGEIPATPFAENHADRDNHLDFLKARLLVWNVVHGHAVNAYADGNWAYVLNNESGQAISGKALRTQYNDLNVEVKHLLDQSCEVVFPRDIEKKALDKTLPINNKDYGAHMGFAVFVLATLLRTGQIKSFRELWYLARQFRVCVPGFKKRPHKGTVVGDAFALSRSGGQQQVKLLPTVDVLGVLLTTPLDNQYSDFEEQFKPQRGKPLNVQVLLSSGKLQLTCCEDRNVNGLKRPLIVHTPPQSIPAVLGVLEFYYNTLGFDQENMGAGAASSSANPKQDLFSLFWWSAHGCLDGAGSAAKSDLCLRALYLALFNKPLPAWVPGFVPDLEAMLCKDTGVFLSKINGNDFNQNAAKAFAGGCNWEACLTHLPPVFPEPARFLQRW